MCRFRSSPNSMSNLAPTSWHVQVAIFEADGFALARTKGSHMVFTREGCLRPVIIPKHDEVSGMVIQSNMRTAVMSQARYVELLKRCK
jgi:predicted RNA binding protein YcfA (HicA-like mRNA interferase family)